MSTASSSSSEDSRRFKALSTDVPTLQRQLKATILERNHWKTLSELTQHQIVQNDTQHLLARQQQEQCMHEMQQQIQSLHAALQARKDCDASSTSSGPSRNGAADLSAPIDPRLPQQTKLKLQQLRNELTQSRQAYDALVDQHRLQAKRQHQQDQLQYNNFIEMLTAAVDEKNEAMQRAQQLE